MSYGFNHYDKKSYKESKKRRKQALVAAETGRILPFDVVKRKIILIVFSAVVLISIIVGCIAFAVYFSNNAYSDKNEVYTKDNTELLRIVNKSNVLPNDYVPALKEVNSVKVNSAMYDDLLALISKAEQQGITLKVKTGYVSFDEQQKQYENKLNELLKDDEYTLVRAEATAQKLVPKGGESEFQTGLLVDFDLSDDNSSSFVERNCLNYGFILRYPKSKIGVTGVEYKSSVYRYVGIENAVNMRSFDMSLEEYNEYLANQRLE